MADIINEKGVKREVKKLLDKYGYFWWMPAANGYGRIGISDFNSIKNGVFIAIETKFGYNKPTVAQKAYAESITRENGFAFLVTEKNLEWLDFFLANFEIAVQSQIHGREVPDEAGAAMLNAINALMEGWA